ncbi:MAG: glycosyltransferase family 2 protein [bacterium]|nr:glycosyltransferase family 2 protein [bacterium]
MDPHKFSLSCFFPCYNDSATIEDLVRNVDTVAGEFTDDYEVIVIDDGSMDESRAVLKRLKNEYPRLKLVFHEHNRGYGGALQSGFEASTKDLIFYTDGDGQYDAKELRVLMAKIGTDVDVVNGYKIKRSDPFYRVVIGKCYQITMRFLFGLKIRDVDCDFRLIRNDVLKRLSLSHTSGVICVELVKKLERAGARFVEVPVHHYPRLHGRSQFFSLVRLVRVGVNLIRLWGQLMLKRGNGL